MWISCLSKLLPVYRAQNERLVKEISTAAFPLQFKVSDALWVEPLKAKKKMDPAIIKAREEKQKRRLEKEIRRREKIERQLKPIFELEVPEPLKSELTERKREVNISKEVEKERIILIREWSKVKWKESKSDIMLINRLLRSQQKALDELRAESEELYQAAVQIDTKLLPFKFKGPVETPANENYPLPDGDYIDTSKKWIAENE